MARILKVGLAVVCIAVAGCNVSDSGTSVANNDNNANNTNNSNNGNNSNNSNNSNNGNNSNNSNNGNNSNNSNNDVDAGMDMDEADTGADTGPDELVLPTSYAPTGGSQVMQNNEYKLRVQVGSPSANPTPKGTAYQIKVAPPAR